MTEIRLGRRHARTATAAQVRIRRFEIWYVAGALVSGVTYGMLPMLLPQHVALRGGSALTVGLVMASLMLGCVVAPLWRSVAERYGIQRALAASLIAVGAVALLLVAAGTGAVIWMVGAAIVGMCCTAATVVGGLHVTDHAPRGDWPRRQEVAAQTWAAGIAGGLLLAGLFSILSFIDGGIAFGALVLLVASGIALVWMPWMPRRRRHSTRGDVLDFEGHPVMHQAPDPETVRPVDDTRWQVAFALFVVGIALLTLASAALLFQLPLMASATFGLDPAGLALVLGAAALASIICYPAVGRTARTQDPVDLTIRATWMRAVVFGVLALLSLVIDPWATAAVVGLLFVYRNTWPSVYAGVTACSFELVPPEFRRFAMGVMSVALAVAAVGAGVFSGSVVATLGYEGLAFGVWGIALLAGFVLATLRVWRRHLVAISWA